MSIRPRGEDIWQIDIYLGRDPKTRKRIRDTHTFVGKFKAAEKVRIPRKPIACSTLMPISHST